MLKSTITRLIDYYNSLFVCSYYQIQPQSPPVRINIANFKQQLIVMIFEEILPCCSSENVLISIKISLSLIIDVLMKLRAYFQKRERTAVRIT